MLFIRCVHYRPDLYNEFLILGVMPEMEEIIQAKKVYREFINRFPVSMVSDWKASDTFYHHVEDNFKAVLEYVSRFEYKDDFSELKLQPHYESVLNVLLLAVNGYHAKAYAALCEIMKNIRNLLDPDNTGSDPFVLPSNHRFSLYKMRLNPTETDHNDFFHIPFEKLHLTKNNRFSLQGIPCIYYGNSIYVCWEEMSRPMLENSYIVQANMHLKMVELSITPDYLDFGFMVNVPEDKLISHFKTQQYECRQFLLLLPLIFTCSVKVKYNSSIFRPEYLLPHLLLEWVKDSEQYFGIKYLSTQTSLLDKNALHLYTNFYNCVIPVKEVKESGYCESLRSKIQWTDPINYHALKLLNAMPTVEYRPGEVPNALGFYHKTYRYEQTVFGQLEKVLTKMKAY